MRGAVAASGVYCAIVGRRLQTAARTFAAETRANLEGKKGVPKASPYSIFLGSCCRVSDLQ
jgi:hypothetical protein